MTSKIDEAGGIFYLKQMKEAGYTDKHLDYILGYKTYGNINKWLKRIHGITWEEL